MCVPNDGDLSNAVMMYAHMPWLVARSHTAETVGEDGEGMGGEGEERKGRRLEGQRWGEGKRKQKSKRAVSIINGSLVYGERDLMWLPGL